MDGGRSCCGSGQGSLVALEGLHGSSRKRGLLRGGMNAGQGINQVQGAQGGDFPQGAGAELGFKIVFQRKDFLFDVRSFRITQFSAFRIAHGKALRTEFTDQVLHVVGVRRVIDMAEGIRLLQ